MHAQARQLLLLSTQGNISFRLRFLNKYLTHSDHTPVSYIPRMVDLERTCNFIIDHNCHNCEKRILTPEITNLCMQVLCVANQ